MSFKDVILFLVIPIILSCGRGKGSSSPNQPAQGEIITAIQNASAEFQIPSRLLMAVGFKESGLSPTPSSSLYNAEQSLGISVGETAFGLSFESLGIDKTAENLTLPAQIQAYAKLVRTYIDQQDLSLNAAIGNLDELYDWLWQLSQLHRSSNSNRKNVQIIFAMELINILNAGFTWQSPDSAEIVQLTPETSPILTENFSTQIQKNLRLDTQKSEIFSVDYMQLTFDQGSGQVNTPNHVRVIHCPFSLSACLEIQNKTTNIEEARMQAHYIIPPDQDVLQNPIKILQHRIPVLVTDSLGRSELIQDAVVIMLVGDSGRYVEGKRVESNPLWYSNYQLKNMGEIIHGVCELMKQENPSINKEVCKTPGVSGGVQFMSQGSSENYRWGNIADYNKDIFWTYVNSPDELGGVAEFRFVNQDRIYSAGATINFDLNFIRGARKVEIELMERCLNGKSVWATLQTHYVRDTASISLDTVLYQKGPNNNGRHFLRALVYGEENQLKSWTTTDLFIRDFEEDDYIFAELDACS